MEYRSKADVVADGIRLLVTSGELAPGAVLRQRDLAGRFGVSPTPVREALRRLEAEGLVETTLHRGATVVRTEAARIVENFLVRAALESLAARLTAERRDEDDLADIRALHDELAARPPDAEDIGELNQRFHLRIYESARSPMLMAMLRMLWSTLDIAPQVLRDHADSVAQHAEILDAIARGDGETAAAVTAHHIDEVRELLRAELAADLDPDPAHANPSSA